MWLPHFNAYAVVGRKTVNPIKNCREDFDFIDYSGRGLQSPTSPMVAMGGGGANSDMMAMAQQGVYGAGGEGGMPRFCSVRSPIHAVYSLIQNDPQGEQIGRQTEIFIHLGISLLESSWQWNNQNKVNKRLVLS